ANELKALSTIFDQAYLSFIELVQAREILDGINEGIVAIDAQGKIAGMNLNAQETLEVTLAEARTRSLSQVLGATPDNGTLYRLIQSTLKEEEEHFHNQVPFHCPSGRELVLSVKVSPLRIKSDHGGLLGAICTFTEQLHP
ncbi:MAG: PAS domain-containing protein, partial [Deltaproteobacteria bacterium]|nr:PAS domain-containing protein [Deltaproteobacteria bacterium]